MSFARKFGIILGIEIISKFSSIKEICSSILINFKKMKTSQDVNKKEQPKNNIQRIFTEEANQKSKQRLNSIIQSWILNKTNGRKSPLTNQKIIDDFLLFMTSENHNTSRFHPGHKHTCSVLSFNSKSSSRNSKYLLSRNVTSINSAQPEDYPPNSSQLPPSSFKSRNLSIGTNSTLQTSIMFQRNKKKNIFFKKRPSFMNIEKKNNVKLVDKIRQAIIVKHNQNQDIKKIDKDSHPKKISQKNFLHAHPFNKPFILENKNEIPKIIKSTKLLTDLSKSPKFGTKTDDNPSSRNISYHSFVTQSKSYFKNADSPEKIKDTESKHVSPNYELLQELKRIQSKRTVNTPSFQIKPHCPSQERVNVGKAANNYRYHLYNMRNKKNLTKYGSFQGRSYSQDQLLQKDNETQNIEYKDQITQSQFPQHKHHTSLLDKVASDMPNFFQIRNYKNKFSKRSNNNGITERTFLPFLRKKKYTEQIYQSPKNSSLFQDESIDTKSLEETKNKAKDDDDEIFSIKINEQDKFHTVDYDVISSENEKKESSFDDSPQIKQIKKKKMNIQEKSIPTPISLTRYRKKSLNILPFLQIKSTSIKKNHSKQVVALKKKNSCEKEKNNNKGKGRGKLKIVLDMKMENSIFSKPGDSMISSIDTEKLNLV